MYGASFIHHAVNQLHNPFHVTAPLIRRRKSESDRRKGEYEEEYVKLGSFSLPPPFTEHSSYSYGHVLTRLLSSGTAAHECVSEEALVHLKSYKYSSVDKSLISKYILQYYVRQSRPVSTWTSYQPIFNSGPPLSNSYRYGLPQIW